MVKPISYSSSTRRYSDGKITGEHEGYFLKGNYLYIIKYYTLDKVMTEYKILFQQLYPNFFSKNGKKKKLRKIEG